MSERVAQIDQSALAANFNLIKTLAPHAKILSVVKSNAYGHGINNIVPVLADKTDAFGVSIVDEAITLRESGVTTDIVVLTGFRNQDELIAASELNIHVVIHEQQQLTCLQEATLENPVRCWLKVDTGMHRLGITPDAVASVYQQLLQNDNVSDDIVLMSHLANADDPYDQTTLKQLESLQQVNRQIGLPMSIANSGAVISTPEAHLDWVRPGILLYGISPLLGGSGEQHQLRPVMTLKSRLIAIQDCQQGDKVSYRGRYTCPAAMRIGVIACGYGDGYPRHAQDGTPVLIRGRRAPLVGNVCMDMFMVDLRNVPQAQVGDEVTLWGQGLPVEEIAHLSDTIAYELVCHMSARVGFEVV